MGIKRSSRGVIRGAIVAALALTGSLPAAASFGGTGAGTTQNPYKIASCAQLQSMSDNLSATYVLTGNIDCSDTVTWNSGAGFLPVGDSVAGPFTGTLDGQNFTVTGLYIHRPSTTETAGLIGYATGATIKRINLRAGSVYSPWTGYNGTLAGWTENSHFSDCSSTTTMSGDGGAGLVGLMLGGDMHRCWYNGTVNAPAAGYTAGLVKVIDQGVTISDVYTAGTLNGETYSGTLIGSVDASTVTNAYSSMDDTSHATVYSGGLFGSIDTFSGATTISNVFYAGHYDDHLTSTSGPLAPFDFGATVTGAYYDTTACGCATDPTGDITAVNSGGSQPSYFKGNSTNAPMSAWDFSAIWQTNTAAYPTLRALATPTDSDTDGIADSVEAAGPGSGDANHDGLPDSTQSNVAAIVDGVTGQYAAAETNCDSLANVQSSAEATGTGRDVGFDYPAGLLSFSVNCATAGQTATMHLFFYTGASPSGLVLRKYNTSGTYTTVPGATLTGTTLGGQAVVEATYSITDGGPFDADGVANGVIVDPVGLGSSATAVPNTGLGGLAAS